MAANDDGMSYPTDSIVSKSARKHYRVPVRSQHWQLRSLISAEKRHLVYFPGGSGCNHVQRLNTLTNECETIKLLTFAPRCLVAASGWLCCGSETGDFVAIRLDDGSEDSQSSGLIGLELDAETRHQLGLDELRDDPLLSLLAQARRSNKSLIAKSMKLAKDRVNCVTLWFPSTMLPAADTAYTEGVAVLANNDRTVVLVSLRDFDRNEKTEPLDVVTYPDFVNRAIISPDGRLLIAILDDPYLYVHERVERPERSAESPSSSSGEASGYHWEPRQRFLLKSQRKDDRSDSRGSFAACFSSSGAYLAVGTQHGTISIFDTTLLTEFGSEPLITTFKSSRPESGPGAVRDMAFCPGPFDILAWTEDRGHIGFADMRSNFIIRQVVDINVEGDFDHIDILDRNTIDPRLLSSQGERRNNRSTPSGTTRRPPHLEGLETLNQPLTANETLVLEAIQGDRRRRDRVSPRGAEEGSRGLPDLTWTYLSNFRGNNSDSPGSRERSSSVGRAMGEMLGSYRDQRERMSERVRTARQLVREAAESRPPIRRPDQRLMDRIGETVQAMRDQRERPDAAYLNVLEILQARERPAGEADHEDSALLVPLVNRWEESAIRGTLDHGVFEVPPSPDNTAGLAWTSDGRSLFVGAQNGIYELHINVQSRKFCPSITMS